MKKASKLKWLGMLAGLGLAVSGNAMAHLKVHSKGGLKVYDSQDGAYWFTVGGRLHLDQTFFMGKGDSRRGFNDPGVIAGDVTDGFRSGGNIRRALVDFAGGAGKDLSYMVSLNFRPSTYANIGTAGEWRHVFIEKAFLNYKGAGYDSNIAFGQFYIPFGLENWGSSNHLMFLEPSLMSGVTNSLTARGFGVYADMPVNDFVTVAGSLYQPDINKSRFSSSNPGSAQKSDKWAVAGRVTASPVHTDGKVYHFGASAVHQSVSSVQDVTANSVLKSSTRVFPVAGHPEAITRSNLNNPILSASIPAVKSIRIGGVEAGAIFGPTTLQAEYQTIQYRRDLNAPYVSGIKNLGATINETTRSKTIRQNGWHVQAGYVLTGESREYDFATGTFGGVKPKQSGGAWEVTARYSYANLNNKEISGNKATNMTVGMNWFVNDNIRVTANVIRSVTTQSVTSIPKKRRLTIVGLRGQLVW